jgi:thiazole synthase ThiGH ThiG subunit
VIRTWVRRTKILATLGPACDDPRTVAAMVEAGVDACRINCALARACRERRLAVGVPVVVAAGVRSRTPNMIALRERPSTPSGTPRRCPQTRKRRRERRLDDKLPR